MPRQRRPGARRSRTSWRLDDRQRRQRPRGNKQRHALVAATHHRTMFNATHQEEAAANAAAKERARQEAAERGEVRQSAVRAGVYVCCAGVRRPGRTSRGRRGGGQLRIVLMCLVVSHTCRRRRRSLPQIRYAAACFGTTDIGKWTPHPTTPNLASATQAARLSKIHSLELCGATTAHCTLSEKESTRGVF